MAGSTIFAQIFFSAKNLVIRASFSRVSLHTCCYQLLRTFLTRYSYLVLLTRYNSYLVFFFFSRTSAHKRDSGARFYDHLRQLLSTFKMFDYWYMPITKFEYACEFEEIARIKFEQMPKYFTRLLSLFLYSLTLLHLFPYTVLHK